MGNKTRPSGLPPELMGAAVFAALFLIFLAVFRAGPTISLIVGIVTGMATWYSTRQPVDESEKELARFKQLLTQICFRCHHDRLESACRTTLEALQASDEKIPFAISVRDLIPVLEELYRDAKTPSDRDKNDVAEMLETFTELGIGTFRARLRSPGDSAQEITAALREAHGELQQINETK